jgi:acetyl-CoA carboxylase alpha subunit
MADKNGVIFNFFIETKTAFSDFNDERSGVGEALIEGLIDFSDFSVPFSGNGILQKGLMNEHNIFLDFH